jgi:subtilase family serine protease
VGVVTIRTAFARLTTAALTLPVLLGGGAAPAVVTHVMTPATAGSGLDETLGGSVPCPAPFCYTPAQLRAAYDIEPLIKSGIDGTGATIVIVDAFWDPSIRDDLQAFDTAFGLPAPPQFDIVMPDGQPAFNLVWAKEISLDVQWAHVVAPGARLVLVLAKTSDDADLLSATRYAIHHDLGDVISQSFAEAESCADPRLLRQEHAVFERAKSKGITLVAGSGDFGAVNRLCDGSLSTVPAAATPASDPDVTAVGGTRLTVDPSGGYVGETGWADVFGASGGGFSSVYRRPGYQAPFVDGNRARGLPDVAYSADGFGAIQYACSSCSRPGTSIFHAIFGTSGGTPQWAGIDALSRQMAGHRQSQLNIRLYHLAKSDAYREAFHDITTGTNSFAGVTGFSAGPGWDPVTGLGTPDVAKLVPLLS